MAVMRSHTKGEIHTQDFLLNQGPSFPSSDPEAPGRYLTPLFIRQSKSRSRSGVSLEPTDKKPLRGCPLEIIESEQNLLRKIIAHSSDQTLKFLCVFEYHSERPRWIHIIVAEKLHPRHLLIDYIRSIFLFHRKSWTLFLKRAKIMDYPIGEKFIPPDCYSALTKHTKLRLTSATTKMYFKEMEKRLAPHVEKANIKAKSKENIKAKSNK